MTADRSLSSSIGSELQGLGGDLVCTVCKRQEPLGDVGHNLSNGWPECCGYTMRWVTARQLAEGKLYG